MKKILAVLLAVMILFALVGCANSDQTDHKEEETKEETVEENTKESETVEDGNEEKSDTLIVYFSWSNKKRLESNGLIVLAVLSPGICGFDFNGDWLNMGHI